MKLCLFRHGVAVERGTKGIADDDRPLTKEGRRRTREAARGVRRLDLGVDVVVTSPLPRARETAAILAEALKLKAPREDARLAEEPEDILALVGELKGACPMIVGHEPTLSDALSRLVFGGGRGEELFRFKKAGLAVVEFPSSKERGRGTLLLFAGPSVLRRLGRP